ncbi:MAG: bifunctional aspartate kinase/homoserine dehydrogenase I [Bacteroidaceae bacterium]|nr:bifunctional aspartate kinase/homoserine dehydrogenase I [Bacteroidaceae bacterium]
MKVLKFGGSSVGSIPGLLNVKKIVESQNDKVMVVVSALGDTTDHLITISRKAEQGDRTYLDDLNRLEAYHHEILSHKQWAEDNEQTSRKIDALFDELRSICQGVCLIRDLSDKTLNAIMSYGERISSNIVSAVLRNAVLFDSLQFIKTEKKKDCNVLNTDLTSMLIKEQFSGDLPQTSLIPGFIATDTHSDEITNLGRGGSDYTASILAANLNAEALEIWTDVDGFMTADPKVINTAYTIEHLSYHEAMELCNFGAQVVYPPTIYPACIRNIPILVKNTYNPEGQGTIIMQECMEEDRAIKGISSINNTSLITVSGLSMVGVIGVNRRIFTTLADNNISVFLVSQASSENSTSIGVRNEDAQLASEVLNSEFSKEISTGAMFPMKVEKNLASIAVVGENMKHTPGIAGKLFGTLGRNGISVIACAQGASETNISFVVEKDYLRKSLNVIHDSFFLSEYQELNLFICGIGTVGGKLIEQILSQKEKLMRERNLKLNIVGIANSRKGIFTRQGIDLEHYQELLDKSAPCDIQRLKEEVIGMNIFNSVFVDCTASNDVAGLYKDFFEHSISVVAANKVAASSEYENYARLKALARRKNVKFLFETNVGAGLPVINTINDLSNSGDRVQKIEAVLSGTLNFIFNTISAEIPFSETVRMAKEQGYSEPDPRIDLSGKDVIRKIVILSREAGYKVNQEDVLADLFIPQEFFSCTTDEFWAGLPTLDADFEKRRKTLEENGKRWRFVASMEEGRCSVSLKEVGQRHPFYGLEGSNNIIMLTTERYHDYPMLIQGYGAGASVTAAGVFADIMSIANI